MKKLLALALLISVPAFSSQNEEEGKVFKGNWTASYTLKDGSVCEHTPTYTSLGIMKSGTGISLKSKSFNKIPMSEEGLELKTNSAQEEFVAALRRSGLY